MLERIIIAICCFMCAVPFLIIATYNKKDKRTPIVFWSGSEKKLKEQIKDITGYNEQMAKIYKKCVITFLLCGVGGVVYPLLGYILLGCTCTVGIYCLYREYKRILDRYSV